MPGSSRPLSAARKIWRITSGTYADRAFDGEGARRFGGRWNHPGTAIVYASEHLSLAALELLVQLDPDTAPADWWAVSGILPAGLGVSELEITDLPANWRAYPAPESLQDIGSEWARQAETAVLSVPSAVIPRERNLLLNPAHPAARRFRVGPPERFVFDPRLWA